VVSEAEPPIRPDGPATAAIVLSATLLGLVVGALGAVALDFLNNTIRSAEQFEYLFGLECFGVVPHLAADAPHRRSRKGAIAQKGKAQDLVLQPDALDCGSVQRVAKRIQERCAVHGVRSLAVTAAIPGEGATTLSIGLAKAMAKAGIRVLLIDGVPESAAASRAIDPKQHVSLQSIEQAKGDCGNARSEALESAFDLLPPAELPMADAWSLCPAKLNNCVGEALKRYDFVIIDMPSLASGPDVRATGRVVDGILLVVRWGRTDSELVRQAAQSAGDAQLKFFAGVLNMADEQVMRAYGA